MSSLWNLIKKEFDRIKTDKKSLIMLFLLPLITILIFGLSTGGPTYATYLDLAVVSYDSQFWNGTGYSEYDTILIDSFSNGTLTSVEQNRVFNFSNGFNETNLYDILPKNVTILLFEGNIQALIIIPPNFSETVRDSNNSALICIYDASSGSMADSISVSLQVPLATFRAKTSNFNGLVIAFPYPESEVPIWFNQILNYAAPVMIVIIILGTSINLTALSVVSEGPLPRMLLTPASKTSSILAKFISYSGIMVIQSLVIFFGSMAFGLYVQGNLVHILLILILTGLSGVSIGLLISCVSTTEQQANQLYIAVFIFLILFSGAFIPSDTMPGGAQAFTNSLPIIHAVQMFMDVAYRGFGLDPSRVFAMITFILALLIVSIILFQFRKMEV
ncbi:MAG: ABC transporter permease [Promethearchaeota archaeon]|nr:MAG: ABC transporter permease [Candidatus Lokiarchaeota archaeon]